MINYLAPPFLSEQVFAAPHATFCGMNFRDMEQFHLENQRRCSSAMWESAKLDDAKAHLQAQPTLLSERSEPRLTRGPIISLPMSVSFREDLMTIPRLWLEADRLGPLVQDWISELNLNPIAKFV
jgi:hypothetical protein